MPYAVIIARQRSGTVAFAELLRNAFALNVHGEILDPAAGSPVISETEGVATWPRLQAFLQHLHDDDAFHLVDIKVASLGAVSAPFRSPSLPPSLIDLLRKHQSKIIRLHRHPMAQWVSGLIANRSGIWHQRSEGEVRPEKVRVDPTALENFFKACAREDVVVAEWLDGLPILNLNYDQVFAQESYVDVLSQVSQFLGRIPKPGWENARPDQIKIAHRSLAENIENIGDVTCYLPIHDAVQSAGEPNAEAPSRLCLDDFPVDTHGRIKSCSDVLQRLIVDGVLSEDHFRDKVVLDWECGDGAYSVAFALAGAKLVFGSDQWLDLDRLPACARKSPQLRCRRADIKSIETELSGSVDLVFANTVSEHIQDLTGSFASLFRVIKPGGYLLLNHDNYYQPVGSHDHGFLRYRSGAIVRQGPACWEEDSNCSLSQAHRDQVAQTLPWTWDQRNEAHLTPLVCANCHYYKRSQPWAHLLYQDEFTTLYPQDSFSTGRPKSSLNKVTIFQLRQFLIEAGFEIEKEGRIVVANEPPESLLRGPQQFTALDLKTNIYRVLVRKKDARVQ